MSARDDSGGKGLLITLELVKNRKTKELANEEGKQVFLRCLKKGLLTITPKAKLRLAPPLCITETLAIKGLDILEQVLTEVERDMGYRK